MESREWYGSAKTMCDALVKEKKITWTKSGKENEKREADLYDMLEKAATNEKREERDRDQHGEGKKRKMRQRVSLQK